MDMLPEEFTISIRDNGKGFVMPAGSKPNGGDGLGNMRQRVESLGGRLEIFSQPGQGTQVRLSVPIEN
jgi:signal transduction histidine kinase